MVGKRAAIKIRQLYCAWRLPQERRDPSLSRADYLERLAKDLKEYYGFLRELIDMFLLVSFGDIVS